MILYDRDSNATIEVKVDKEELLELFILKSKKQARIIDNFMHHHGEKPNAQDYPIQMVDDEYEFEI